MSELPIRLKQCWNGFDRGAEVRFHEGLARELIRLGIAETIDNKDPPPADKKRKSRGS